MENPWFQAGLFGVGLALYILLGIILWGVLDWYINPQDSTEKKDLIQALGLIMAGVAGAIGIFFTWRSQRITKRAHDDNQDAVREQLELTRQSQDRNQKNTVQQLENTQEELRLTREGQITERFTRAIDQLGNDSLEIKLGGIYALERIARASEEDHWPIMEILTAYVRQHAPWAQEEEKAEENSNEESMPAEVQSPDPDIQAIMTVLRRRTRTFGHGEPEPLNLVETNLTGVDISEANLTGAYLWGADLRSAELSGANLAGAKLLGVSLLRRADLLGANLTGANLTGADLSEVNLSEMNLWGVILSGANLSGANLAGATGLTQEQINQAYGDDATVLPEGFVHPEHWIKSTDEPPNGEE